MLVEVAFKKGDTVSLKLASGEEIVGKFNAGGGGTYELIKPMVLIANEKGLGLAPFMFSVAPEGKFIFNGDSVTCVGKTEGEIAKQYIATTTGIVQPDKGILV
jgi:hypothetical protein|tara:strand:+ start:82 stop:390 length:309 start_codon:yes stop_codon:yes gene_type:complete